MRVFKFFIGEMYYAFAAETKELAIAACNELLGEPIEACEEIPQHQWDKRFIDTWAGSDFSVKPIRFSIREIMTGTEPQMIFTNDLNAL